jgi:molybdopterin-containing oxidoreductase family iron-sulfur binding subunit
MSTERQHWRSLGELEGTPGSRAFREREFVEGASEAPDAVSRREVLTLLGASVSLATLAACRRPEEGIVPYVEAPEQVIPGVPRHYATTMPSGHTAYGLVVESHEGRPTKIEGNTLHPGSLGSSSARVQSAILDLYDPDRSREVLKDGEESTWEAFVSAWEGRAAVHAADGGAGLALVLPPFSSPTLFRLVEELRAAYPHALVVAHDPAGDVNVHEGLHQATGRDLVPVHRLDEADVVVCLDADILHADPEMIRHTRGFARRRRVSAPGDQMSRLWAVEPVLSVTGAKADHRQRLAARHIPAFTAALAARLAAGGLEIEAPEASVEGVDEAWLQALADDLLAHRGTSLVVAGPQQPPAVHAAALALNAALGNVGTTVEYHEPVDALHADRDGLAGLVGAMSAGEVKTLVVLGANPAYDAPGELDFAAAAASVEEIVHLGSHRDETGALAHWHLPVAHFLEAWGDARAACGTLSVIQPMILPLYGGKSAVEVLGLLARGVETPGYDLLRETWQPLLSEEDFERHWRQVLHDGVVPNSALPHVEAPESGAVISDLAAPSGGDHELLFRPCPKVHDGRSANNAWLQELPDAITRVTWDNPLLLSPATAAARGLDDGDLVRVDVSGRSLEVPVFRVPGMADGTLVLTLGYGRRAAGRVGNGVGFDAYAVRPAASPDRTSDVTLESLGRRYPLAQTQEHGTMDGRHLVREATLEHYREDPHFAQHHHEASTLWKEHEYDSSPQWGMVIDLNACTGCNACAVACQSENNIPVVGKDQVSRGREMAWIRVDRYYTGEPEDAGAVFQPVPCMHCENAPCEQVCPVAATVHDEQGLNVMVYNRCIGTRYCSNNCPYKVRRFNFFNYTKGTPEPLKMANNPDVTVRSRGVMEKCTYCVQRLNAARIDARLGGRELKDGDARTACQQACPAEAIHFGNLQDLESQVARARGLDRNYAILEEINSKARTTYQARLRNPHPGLGGGDEEKDHA